MRHNRPRRNRFRTNNRSYRSNNSNGHTKHGSNSIFNGGQRTNLSRGNQNPSELFAKYTSLAKEALSTGDKILSENYFQHADHFSRILSIKNANQKVEATNKVENIEENINEEKDNKEVEKS